MVVEDKEITITEDFSSDMQLSQQSNINTIDTPQDIVSTPNLLDTENHDDYYKNIFSVIISMLDSSISRGNIEKLENDLLEVKLRYERCDQNSHAVEMKIEEAQYVLMCKYLETRNIEKAKALCENFDEVMEEYVIHRIKNSTNDFAYDDNYYAAMLKIDICERINIEVNSIKFWEGVLNIEKPYLNYRLPPQWQPDNIGLVLAPNHSLGFSFNSYNYFGFVKVFKIRYNPKSEKNKMNLGDVQKLKEYLVRPKITKNIRIIFEEGIENIYLDLNNVNILCNFSIKLPSTAKRIGGNLFRGNVNIQNVDLSGTRIESIDDGTFYNSNIKKLIVPSTLKSIGKNAFANCDNLKDVDLSNTKVSKINRNAFYNSGLRKIKVSNSLSFIDLEAFSKCKDLKKLDLSKTQITALDSGFLAYSGVKKVKLPSNISTVDFGVFSDCKDLKEIDLSNTKIKKIGAYSFFNSSIEKIRLPQSIEEIEYEAFGKCNNLKNIDFRKTNLRKIAPYAFYSSGIKNIKLPKCLKEVSSTSFSACDNLKNLDMPN